MKFFPEKPDASPSIYAYEDTHPKYAGLLKVGYTTGDAKKRVAQQYPTKRPGGAPYKIHFEESAMRMDGTSFTDHDVHRYLRKKGFRNPDGEWFECTVKDIQAAVIALQTNQLNEESRTQTFGMRPEQREAVQKAVDYFESYKDEKGKVPHFLWNAKMRFGKTFAAYQLALKMSWKKVLILTFKPAVQSAWEDDLKSHVDFEGWQFISRDGLQFEEADRSKPFVCFASFQDYLGKTKIGAIKPKNEWVHEINWDCVIFDEYHFGAWREGAKGLFAADESEDGEVEAEYKDGQEFVDEEILPVTTGHYLYLSGTPFRAIGTGEFIEEQIYNWTYSDEQRAKTTWAGADNPYLSLPRMVLMTYQLPDSIIEIAKGGEFDEFDLNTFFSAEGSFQGAKFKFENEVQAWLDLIRGQHIATSLDNLKLGAKKPPMPYSHAPLLSVLSHTLWFLPNVASCWAMKNLLEKRNNLFYHDYTVNVCAGTSAGVGLNALGPVLESMHKPLESKTITLTCGKLTTGVTVRPWTGIFMLRSTKSPETYFQSAFRVQSPWTIKNPDGNSPNKEEIIKQECYVFDFAPDRALRQIADYSCKLDVEEANPETKVSEFIQFLPVLAYDGSTMKEIDAAAILDWAMSGTSATLLAKRWESALLVNVDNGTLAKLMANEDAMRALSNIEGFRSLNQDIETIINKSEAVKKAKTKASEKDLTEKEKKQLSEDEKEYKSKRKLIQEKLIKFATRIPVFMYLTDYREHSLKDVITQLEPGLFKRVTGLDVKDFELLVSLNVFNSSLMNDAVYKFKRYEDSSLSYTGIAKHKGLKIGLFDTVINPEDVRNAFVNSSEMQKLNVY